MVQCPNYRICDTFRSAGIAASKQDSHRNRFYLAICKLPKSFIYIISSSPCSFNHFLSKKEDLCISALQPTVFYLGRLLSTQSAPYPSYVKLMSQTFSIFPTQNPRKTHNFIRVMVN